MDNQPSELRLTLYRRFCNHGLQQQISPRFLVYIALFRCTLICPRIRVGGGGGTVQCTQCTLVWVDFMYKLHTKYIDYSKLNEGI